MAVEIKEVKKGSIADRLGLCPCDTLLKINGRDIKDVLDYRFYLADGDLSLTVLQDGKELDKRVKKHEYEDIGLEFETYLMDKQRRCRNKCVFCFIDQMPPGLRESLYFKDDDSRLSFLFGNYITLTNISEEDINRVVAMKTSPVNISVHTMNPKLRVSMMRNKNAGESLKYIKKLTDSGIKVNAQLVLCPGINDGGELEFSLGELCKLAPNLQSIAAVPVGLTKYRENLPKLKPYTKDESRAVISIIEGFAGDNIKKYGGAICYASDEFYIRAGLDLPKYEGYGDFDQLENGVGLLRLLEHEFLDALETENAHEIDRRVTIATGVLAKPLINKLAGMAMKKFAKLKIEVIAVENKFFGERVTVAGLVTGNDLIAALKLQNIGKQALIPSVMLRREGDLFIDGVSLSDAEKALGCEITAVKNDGYELLEKIIGG